MAFAAPTQLTTVNSNTATQTTMASGSIIFPTTGQAVLGLALFTVSGTATAETFTCADTVPNTWTVVSPVNDTASAAAHSAFAYFLYPSGGAATTTTVTVSWATAANMRFGWFGYTTGHLTAAPVDVSGTAVGTATATTLTTTTSATRTTNNDLGLVVYQVGNATGPTGYPAAGWTSLANLSDATRARTSAFPYQITSGGSGTTLGSGALGNTATTLTPPVGTITTFKPSIAAAAVSMLGLLGVG